MPSSTTKVGMAPLPCSIDTTLSWEQFLRAQESPVRAAAAPGGHRGHTAGTMPSFILEKPPQSQRGLGPAAIPWIFAWFPPVLHREEPPQGQPGSCPMSSASTKE